ncbi:L-amino-acid oxidase BmooLAAO-I-like isoform X1 [Dreissena polymorpha]|uniref:Amine oxidase domain-containing protein n=1 Tax=Dreissena polymorpha TaxID=45954 RepID=A0A9D4MCL2_DREPO|nr:L-amino-acid oxidase BmooLAAO-I-like isoform X1 [Dreissena polymorpha]KAH3873739.1 hypothetical protein DPMN_036976 [Dreissena polymorpha]
MLRSTAPGFKRNIWLGRRQFGGCSKSGNLLPLYKCVASKKPLQQDDLYKERMTNIVEGGLRYAYAKEHEPQNAEAYKYKKVEPSQVRDVKVVGAGMAGLAIAYELAQIGHNVTILEMQGRAGGRVKTFYEFTDGLHCEGGAMRIPPNHYLTHHYFRAFDVKLRPFQNYQPNGYMYLYGNKIRMQEFHNRNNDFSNEHWPGWDVNLSKDVKQKLEIKGILGYFDATIQPVIDELGESPTQEVWAKWVDKWSKYSTEDFLRSQTFIRPDGLNLQPWPEQAINGYKVSSYSPTLSGSFVADLRDIIGQWWATDLQTPKDGMTALTRGFLARNVGGWNKDVQLSKNLQYGIKVETIDRKHINDKLRLQGICKASGQNDKTYEADAVFVTVPLNILRQMDVPLLSREKQQAIAGITYAASTKIMIQCKRRFWQDDVGQGGFSKSSDMIGQLHYPDYDGSNILKDERGVLLVYTWDKDALAFGSQSHEDAIQSAVNEISKIHPEMKREVELGNVQAWYSDPATLGAYASLKPHEYLEHLQRLWKSDHPLYLAGEALSWSNGWIQGAIFSGLSQAFCFQSHIEGRPGRLPW